MDDLVHDIVDQWEANIAAHRKTSPRELCADHPDLFGEVAKVISALEWARYLQATFFGFLQPTVLQDEKRIVGRFELVEIIGGGSFGTVWRAFDPQLKREVALKLQNPNRSQTRDALLDEARLLSRLNHPGIISVHEVGVDNGCVFLVSELSDGQNLAEFLGNNPLGRADAIKVLEQLGSALDYAHKQNVIHRDLKPANILIDSQKRVRICDFGLGVASGTPPSEPVGTWRYMSPEQKSGDSIDWRSDLYSFALIAGDLLNPQSKKEEPPSRNQKTPKSRFAPKAFAKGLSTNPENRFFSAARLVAAIKREQLLRLGRKVLCVAVVIFLVWILAQNSFVKRKYLEWSAPDGLAVRIVEDQDQNSSSRSIAVALKGPVEISPEKSPFTNASAFVFPPRLNDAPESGLIIDKTPLQNEVGFAVSFWYFQEQATERSTLLHLGEASGFANSTVPQLTIWLDERQHLNGLSYWRFREVSNRNPEIDTCLNVGDSLGKWRHFAVVFERADIELESSGFLRIYIDGRPVYERPETRLYLILRNKKAKLTVGSALKDSPTKHPSAGFVGMIVDLKIWAWPLGNEKINALSRRLPQ